MRMLAIETATEACSVALFEAGRLLDHRHELLGRGHAERLVPMIAELPDKGRAEQIRVSLGPGSFTGVRIGIAVARALGIAWGSEVLGYPTLSLVARMHGTVEDDRPALLVCMNGGHGEWYVQPFSAERSPVAPYRSLAPAAAVRDHDEPSVLGSRAAEFVALRGKGEAFDLLPDARFAEALAHDQLSRKLAPLYGRAPDAKLPRP